MRFGCQAALAFAVGVGAGKAGFLVVVLVGGQAVVQAAEEAAEEVALGGGGGWGGGPDGPGLGAGDAAAGVGEGGQEGGVGLAQVRAELVVRGGARPDRILLGATSTAIACASSVSADSGRWACRSVRRMFARTTASPWSDLRPATECRSR
jgi:hypothetical protein